MGIYQNVGAQLKRKSVRLSPFQADKLKHIEELFNRTDQQFFSDAVDYFYMNYLEVQTGRISYSQAMKQGMLEMLDDYIKLAEIKGLERKPYFLRRKR